MNTSIRELDKLQILISQDHKMCKNSAIDFHVDGHWVFIFEDGLTTKTKNFPQIPPKLIKQVTLKDFKENYIKTKVKYGRVVVSNGIANLINSLYTN